MSIVTDALNRLQSARASLKPAAHDLGQKPQDTPPPSTETETFGEPNESPSYTRFLTVSAGSFLVVAAMALGFYWWGESLVLDLPRSTPHQKDRAHIHQKNISLEQMGEGSLEKNHLHPTQSSAEVLSNAQVTVAPVLERAQTEDNPSQTSDTKEENLVIRLSNEASAESASVQPPLPLKVASPVGDATSSVSTPDVKIQESPGTSESIESHPENQTSVPDHSVAHGKVDGDHERAIGLDDSPQVKELTRSDFSLTDPSSNIPSKQAVAKKFTLHTEERDRSREREVLEVASLPTKHESTRAAAETVRGLAQPSHDATIEESSSGTITDSAVIAPKPLSSKHEPTTSQDAQPQNITPVDGTVDGALSSHQRLVKARLLIGQNAHAEAITILQPLFASPPSSWEPWFWMGTAHLGVGDLEKAEESFMEGLVRDDSVGYLWVQRAVVAQQRGHYGKAMDALRQAEFLAPELPEVHLNLAYNLEYQGNIRLAHQHYQEYLSLTEGQSTYHTVRRKVLERVLRLGSS